MGTNQGRLLSALAVILLGACSNGPTVYQDPSAIAVLSSTQNSSVHGVATFVRSGSVAVVNLNMAGFKPNTVHGLHIHDSGDCTARDGSSAGGHFNPGGTAHGAANGTVHHAGDLPSLRADAHGVASIDVIVPGVTLGEGPTSIKGRSLVVHGKADDYTTQPSGNSGPRVACGVI